jgi:hypothetical protein
MVINVCHILAACDTAKVDLSLSTTLMMKSFSVLVQSCFLFKMPVTKDTLLYSGAKLD